MDEIVKHINDTNASYRQLGAGDAKNTDLFLDSEQYKLFENSGEHITVRYNKENLSMAILFIASILPRKFDNSANHTTISYSKDFVIRELQKLDGFFTVEGESVSTRTQTWNVRKDILKRSGKTDSRFYFNGLFEDYTFEDEHGANQSAKFTIRDYLAGGYSDIHIKKLENGVFNVWITNALKPDFNEKDTEEEITDSNMYPADNLLRQVIYYGAPGTGKSHTIKEETKDKHVIRTTFHPDSDYSTFVGAYKPTTKECYVRDSTGRVVVEESKKVIEDRIIYTFVEQAFLQAYVNAWKLYATSGDGKNAEPQYLVIEEINRGNCAQIFGDLFQLLDRKDNGFSEYPITADTDMQNHLAKVFKDIEIPNAEMIDNMYDEPDIAEKIKKGEVLLFPSNLYIWATMNTSDQSLFPIDSAFKRRWDWKYVPISKGVDKETNTELNWRIQVNGSCYDWWSFLEKINERIGSLTSSQDKKLGFFFCKARNGIITVEQFVDKVLFFIWNEVLKDYEKEQDFLKDGDSGNYLTFDQFYGVDANGKTVINEEKAEVLLNNLGVERTQAEENTPAGTDEQNGKSAALDKYESFWKGFNNSYEGSGEYKDIFTNPTGQKRQSWFNLGGLNRKYYLALLVLAQKKVARIQLYFPNGEPEYAKYVDQKVMMGKKLGDTIVTHKSEKCSFLQIEKPFDLDKDDRDTIYRWFHEKSVIFKELCDEIDPK